MRGIIITCVVAAVLSIAFIAQAPAGPTIPAYGVYCANGKVEIDMRSLEQMQSARGKGNVCLLNSFKTRTDAEKLAKSMGGVGGSCKCK